MWSDPSHTNNYQHNLSMGRQMITDTNLNLLDATVMYPCIAPEPQWLQLDHTSSEPQKGSTGTPTRGERDGPYV